MDLEEEDEARKFETSKWLESHFGSESRSSHGSVDPDDGPFLPNTTTNTTSYIHVTMKSCSPRERECQNVHRSNRHYHSAATNTNTNANTGRDSTSPSEYFHGISDWSERYQGKGYFVVVVVVFCYFSFNRRSIKNDSTASENRSTTIDTLSFLRSFKKDLF